MAVAPEPKEAHKPKTSTLSGIKKTGQIPSSDSIKEEIQKKSVEEKSNHLSFGEDAITAAEVLKGWNEFIEKLKSSGRDREYNTLKQTVRVEDDLTIYLKLPNSFQALTIEGLQQELLTYLRSKFNNGNIRLVTEVEKIEEKKMIYTNSEKFDYLAEKYPYLRKLKARLDLDTDF